MLALSRNSDRAQEPVSAKGRILGYKITDLTGNPIAQDLVSHGLKFRFYTE